VYPLKISLANVPMGETYAFFLVEKYFCPVSPEHGFDGSKRQFVSLRRRVMLFLS